MVDPQRRTARVLSAALLLAATPVAAREVRGGQVASSSVGTAGQRQTRDQATPNIAPIGRVDGRIGTRIESRIRNRIDRNYSPQANAVSPFAIAEDQARAAGHPIRH